jgi:hypothetical protein
MRIMAWSRHDAFVQRMGYKVPRGLIFVGFCDGSGAAPGSTAAGAARPLEPGDPRGFAVRYLGLR